jgi:hypothetical protein
MWDKWVGGRGDLRELLQARLPDPAAVRAEIRALRNAGLGPDLRPPAAGARCGIRCGRTAPSLPAASAVFPGWSTPRSARRRCRSCPHGDAGRRRRERRCFSALAWLEVIAASAATTRRRCQHGSPFLGIRPHQPVYRQR